MVVTSLYAPQGAEAAATNKIVVAKGKKAVKSKNIYIGGKTVNFDAIIKGKNVKSGTWSSSNKKVASVDKNGVVKALKNGKVTISFKTKATKKAKSVTVKMTINARTRASKMTLTPAAVTVKEGASADVAVSYELSKKIQAAGGKTTTYKLFAESSDEKVATVSVDGNDKVTVKGVAKSATPVAITVYAAQVTSLAKAKEVKFKLTEKFDVKVTANLEAKQTGANKITVMGSDFVASKSAFVVKNSSGVVLPLKDEIKVNEAKTEAVLEGDTTQIPVGKYTLSYNNSDPVEFEVVKAVVKSITINPTGKAIMGKAAANNVVKNAYAYYTVLNQFGEDVTKSPLASRIQVSGSDNATMISKGKIEFTSTSVNGYQLNLSQISVAVVDIDTGVNANAILTAGEASKVWETSYKGLYDVTKRKFVENITEDDKLANFAILLSAKDQYGNSLVSDDNKGEIQVNLLSITGVNTDSNKEKVKIVTVGDDNYYAFTLKGTKNQPDEKADRAGEVSVQSIVINNGKMGNNKFNVIAATKVDSLTVRPGALGVYEHQDNWLDFTALDANGKELTSWDALNALNNSTNMPNYADGTGADHRKLMFVKKSDGKVGLVYNPGDSVVGSTLDTASITQVLSFISKTNKFSSANLTVRKARKPVSVIGLASDTVRGTTATKNNREFIIKAEKIRFQDQYGNTMTADDIKNCGTNYNVSVVIDNKNLDVAEGFRTVAASNAATTATLGGVIALAGKDTKVVDVVAASTAAATASATGVAKVTLKLLDSSGHDTIKSSEEKSFEIYNARLQDMSSFAIEDPGLRPASNIDPVLENSNKGFEPKVVGYYAGQKIELAKTDDFTVYKDSSTGDPTFAPVPSIDDKEGDVVKKTIARVVINNGKGTTVDKEFSYSKAKRKVAKAEMEDSANKTDFATSQGWAVIKDKFKVKVKDQYDAASTILPYITFSDFDKNLVTIEKNGTADAKIKVTGKTTLTVKFAFPGSSYTFEKVITFE